LLQEMKQFVAENSVQIKKTAAEGTAAGGVYAFTLNEWVAILTIGYLIMQMGYLGWKWIREFKGKRKG